MIPTWQRIADDLRDMAETARLMGNKKDAEILDEAADELERLGHEAQRQP